MTQPIVPLKTSRFRRFDKKNRNEMVLKLQIGQTGNYFGQGIAL
ncbi:hypothetical protein [Streptococcus handemini]